MADAANSAPRKNLLLRIGVHECRNPISIVLGYLRMLQTGRGGELTDMQRKMLSEMEKSTAKLHGVVEEMNDLSELEAGSASFNRGLVDLAALIAREIPNVAAAERAVTIRLIEPSSTVSVKADATRLAKAFNALMFSYSRELITSDELCVALDRVGGSAPPEVRVTLAGADVIDQLRLLPESELSPLVEFRGGLGYRLSIAARVIEGHGGRAFSKLDPDSKPDHPKTSAAVVILPEA